MKQGLKKKNSYIKIADNVGTNWHPISEKEWSKIQDQHWDELSKWLTKNEQK